MARKNNIVIAGVLTLAALLSVSLFGLTTHAAAPDFNSVSTAAATTSLTYITPGTATTTLTYDSLFTGSDQAVLLTQLTASSTSSVLNITAQYSQDGIDWYGDNLIESVNSTSTPAKSIQVGNTYTWLAASTALTSKAIFIPTPTRFTRIQYSMTGAAGGVWGQMVAKKQQPQ